MARRLLLGALVAAAPLAAQMCGNFYGGVDALYWKTTHCPIPFAMASSTRSGGGGMTFSTQKVFNLKGDYDWGVRARLGWTRCCFFTDVSYLWFQATDHVKVRRNGFDRLEAQGGSSNLDFVRTDLRFRYQNVDWRFGTSLHEGDFCHFQVYGHARWLEIDFCNRTFGAEVEGLMTLFEQRACFQAGGPGVGLVGNFSLCRGLTAGGRLGGMAMIGRSRTGRELLADTTNERTFLLQPESRTCLVPGIEVDLHLGYSRECGCAKVGIVVGYEMDYYLDALNYSSSDLTTEDLPSRDCQNVGFGGPYIGLRAKY